MLSISHKRCKEDGNNDDAQDDAEQRKYRYSDEQVPFNIFIKFKEKTKKCTIYTRIYKPIKLLYFWVHFGSKKFIHMYSKPPHFLKNRIQTFEFKNFAGNANCMDGAWKRESSSDCAV
jgi:hypothetical protein